MQNSFKYPSRSLPTPPSLTRRYVHNLLSYKTGKQIMACSSGDDEIYEKNAPISNYEMGFL